jgi:hypothetical protein
VAGREIEEVDGGRMELDVEAVLDTLEDCNLIDIMIARIDYADSFRPALLCCSNRGP